MRLDRGAEAKADVGGPLLAIDTATAQACLALGAPDGRLLAQRVWPAGQRHAETVLDELERLLVEAHLVPAELGGLVVGTGPGAFTGLRVGLATAKTLAHELHRPICGLTTTEALALAAARSGFATGDRPDAARRSGSQGGRDPATRGRPTARLTVLLPAGPNDRYVASYLIRQASTDEPEVETLDPPRLVGHAPPARAERGTAIVAVDLEPRPGRAVEPGETLPAAALDRGREAVAGLGAALLILGARRLAEGRADDAAALVPSYVSLPRGAPEGGGAWSPDLG